MSSSSIGMSGQRPPRGTICANLPDPTARRSLGPWQPPRPRDSRPGLPHRHGRHPLTHVTARPAALPEPPAPAPAPPPRPRQPPQTSDPHVWHQGGRGGRLDGAPAAPLSDRDDVDQAHDAGGGVPLPDVLGRARRRGHQGGRADGVLRSDGDPAGLVPGRRPGGSRRGSGRRAWLAGHRGAAVADARDAAGPGHR